MLGIKPSLKLRLCVKLTVRNWRIWYNIDEGECQLFFVENPGATE